jgi:hypothetical protein
MKPPMKTDPKTAERALFNQIRSRLALDGFNFRRCRSKRLELVGRYFAVDRLSRGNPVCTYADLETAARDLGVWKLNKEAA